VKTKKAAIDRPYRQSSTGRRSLPIGVYEADDVALDVIARHLTRPFSPPIGKADAARAAIHFYAGHIKSAKESE
jgi:hypothetical protein